MGRLVEREGKKLSSLVTDFEGGGGGGGDGGGGD